MYWLIYLNSGKQQLNQNGTFYENMLWLRNRRHATNGLSLMALAYRFQLENISNIRAEEKLK